MQNRVLLENDYLSGDIEHQIGAFVDYHNDPQYHESLTTSHLPMSTSDGTNPFSENGKRSRNGQPDNTAYNIKYKPHNKSHKRAKASNAQAV